MFFCVHAKFFVALITLIQKFDCSADIPLLLFYIPAKINSNLLPVQSIVIFLVSGYMNFVRYVFHLVLVLFLGIQVLLLLQR